MMTRAMNTCNRTDCVIEIVVKNQAKSSLGSVQDEGTKVGMLFSAQRFALGDD